MWPFESDGRGVHRFGFKSKVRLAVYEDGILLKRGPFRPYDHPAGEKFVRDVLDGYFPSEFKESYPDGIVFDLVDKSCETHGEHIRKRNGRSAWGCSWLQHERAGTEGRGWDGGQTLMAG